MLQDIVNKEENKMSGFKYKDFEYDDFTYADFSYDDYEESAQVKEYLNNLNNHNASKPGEYQSKYMGLADEVLNNYMNREKFSYDLNGDALYQQYKDKYVTQGKLASQDVMAQAAAMTGGYGNSYAATVGNQAYQFSLQNLNDIVPELYQMAYNQYQQEGQDMLNQYGLLTDRDSIDYGRYRDSVSDWQTERDYLTNLYNAERTYDYSKYSDNRNFDYGVYSDNRNFAYNQYSDNRNLAQTQYNADRSLAYDDYRNDIADEQWNKTYQQALAEYEYQKQRDLVADQQWQQNYNLQSDLSSYQNQISSLNSQLAAKIDPDDIDYDEETGKVTIKGVEFGGNANNTQVKMNYTGFNTGAGKNFTIMLNGNTYEVQNDGRVDDTKTIDALKNTKTSYGNIKIYNGKIYIVKDNSYYKVEGRTFSKKGYNNLIAELQNVGVL